MDKITDKIDKGWNHIFEEMSTKWADFTKPDTAKLGEKAKGRSKPKKEVTTELEATPTKPTKQSGTGKWNRVKKGHFDTVEENIDREGMK
jgi:hypothetical protein